MLSMNILTDKKNMNNIWVWSIHVDNICVGVNIKDFFFLMQRYTKCWTVQI